MKLSAQPFFNLLVERRKTFTPSWHARSQQADSSIREKVWHVSEPRVPPWNESMTKLFSILPIQRVTTNVVQLKKLNQRFHMFQNNEEASAHYTLPRMENMHSKLQNVTLACLRPSLSHDRFGRSCVPEATCTKAPRITASPQSFSCPLRLEVPFHLFVVAGRH